MRFILTANGMEHDEWSPPSIFDPIKGLISDKSKEITADFKEDIHAFVEDVLTEALAAIGDFLVDFIGAIALLGGGILILAKLAGFKDGFRWAGILFFINVLVKYLLGG